MPVLPSAFRRKRKPLPNEQRLQEDRNVRQIENYHRSRGYTDEAVEQMAEADFQLIQRLNKKKRGLKNISVGGINN